MYDSIVIGLGGHGSATIANLAKNEQKVLGIEQFFSNHSLGSSYGRSRIIRLAYYEDPRYVPLLQSSMALWKELLEYQMTKDNEEQTSTEKLLKICGSLMIGSLDSHIVAGTLHSIQTHKMPHEILSCTDMKSRYPCFNLQPDEIGIYESDAGYLVPELCIDNYCAIAVEHGAEVHYEEKFISWSEVDNTDGTGKIIKVITDKSEYYCKKLVLSVGAWAPEIYGGSISFPLAIERRVLFWFKPLQDESQFKDIPVYIYDLGGGNNFYGFPHQDGAPEGVKVAMHLVRASDNARFCTPTTIDRVVHPEEVDKMKILLSDHIPNLAGELSQTATCMYTVTPDEHFLIDFHPDSSNVILASPCSGHGFKFCSVVGEILSDLCIRGATKHDIDMFKLDNRRLDKDCNVIIA